MTDPLWWSWVPGKTRILWRDARKYDNSLIYRVAIWRGWLHSPSGELTGKCTRCWREEKRRLNVRRRIG